MIYELYMTILHEHKTNNTFTAVSNNITLKQTNKNEHRRNIAHSSIVKRQTQLTIELRNLHMQHKLVQNLRTNQQNKVKNKMKFHLYKKNRKVNIRKLNAIKVEKLIYFQFCSDKICGPRKLYFSAYFSRNIASKIRT